MGTLNGQGALRGWDERVLALNFATLAIVDEILWLPSPAVATTAVRLLYGSATELPEGFLTQVGRGVPVSVAPLLMGSAPLASLLRSRLGPAGTWRAVAGDLKHARALARQRYRELQASLMRGDRLSLSGADSLVRYTYGTRGRWSSREATRRLLDRVVALNYAALVLLVARVPSLSLPPFEELPALPERLPERALASLAEALPPIVVPDFRRLAGCVLRGASVLDGEESMERYQSLFAEMLSFADHQGEVCA